MKILIICPYFFEPHRWMISGYKTALYLSKKHKVVVLTTGRPRYEEINSNLKIYRMWDIFLPDPVNYSFVPGLFFHLLRVIKIEKPDVFLVNKHMFYTSFSILWLRLLGKRVFTQVDTFPGIIWFSRNLFVNIILWVYARTIGLVLLKLSNKIILFHEGLISIADKYRLNYLIIHGGVDLQAIKKAQPAQDLYPKRLNEIRIVYIGRLESVKGYKDLLEVAQEIVQEKPEAKFYFVGNVKDKEKIVKKYQNKQIIFLGHRPDIFSILKTMDIFVLSSYSEGLPNALMEAMACGLACLASSVGGVRCLIKENETGLLFKPGDKKELKKKLTKLMEASSLRQKLGRNASSLIERKFNWDKISQELLELFQKEGEIRIEK